MGKMVLAGYARRSTDLQSEESTGDQIGLCRRCDLAKSGVLLDDYIFTDEGISGALPINQRTGLSALLRAAQQLPRPFDYVLVESTSRLSRIDGEAVRIVETLQFYGVQVYFVSQRVDTSQPDWQMLVGISGFVDANQRRMTAKMTRRGLRATVGRGFNAGGRLYGYRYLRKSVVSNRKKEPSQTKIEIDENQADVVRLIFSQYVDGLSVRDITHGLNEKGYPPPHNQRQLRAGRKKPSWIPATVRLMLQNPRYNGDWDYGKTSWVKNPVTGQRKRVPKPESEWERSHRPELAIIDSQVWAAAQAKIEAGKKGPQRNRKGVRSRFLLSGLMKCHVCGGSYVVVTGTDRANPLFGCSTNWNRGASACANSLRVRKEEIQDAILSDIQKQLLSPPVLSAIVKKVNQRLRAKLRSLKKRSDTIYSGRRQEQEALDRLLDAIESGIDLDDVRSRIAQHRTRRDELDRQIKALNQAHDFDRFKVDESYIEKWLFRVRELVQTDPIAAKAALTSLVGEFTLSPEMVDGIKCVRIEGKANAVGLLRIAGGERFSKEENTGGRVFLSLERMLSSADSVESLEIPFQTRVRAA